MIEHEDAAMRDPVDDLDELEQELEDADAADAPQTAEQIAGVLGHSLDDIDGGTGSVAS